MAAKKRILTACVRLFIERGYNGKTVAEIIKEADVSASSFQNIFRSKDGVLSELAAFMFAGQFKAARTVAGPDDSPAMLYAIETALQLTITELNDNLRDIYVEVYSHEATMEYIYQSTTAELYRIFGSYLPDYTESDFYELEIEIQNSFRAAIGITIIAKPVEIGDLPRSEKKTRRIFDWRGR